MTRAPALTGNRFTTTRLKNDTHSQAEHTNGIVVAISGRFGDELKIRCQLNILGKLYTVEQLGNILITQRSVLRLTPGKRCPEDTIVAAKSPFETHSRGKQLTHIRCAA